MKKKHILLPVVIFAAAVGIIVAVSMMLADKKTDAPAMPSESYRVEFLNEHGLIVSPDVKREEITIPEEFGDVYSEYNELQIQQGFDLLPYKGRKAVLYSYRVLNYPMQSENVVADLIVCDGVLIGCDVSLNEENGFVRPIINEGV